MTTSGSIRITHRMSVSWEREDKTYDPDVRRIWIDIGTMYGDGKIELSREQHQQLTFALDVAHQQVYGDSDD